MPENTRTTPYPIHVLIQFYAELNAPSSASSYHILDSFSAFISRQFNTAASTLRNNLFNFARAQFVSCFNQSIAVIIPLLTTFLQLTCKNPFETHPITMTVAVSSSVVYYLACIALLRYPLCRFAVVAYYCLVSSGYLSVASLVSVLLPDSFSPFVYAVFALLSASELLQWLYHKMQAEDDDTEFRVQTGPVRWFLNNMSNVMGNSSGQRLLPI